MNSTFGRFALGGATRRPVPATAVVPTAVPMNSRRVTLRGMRGMLTRGGGNGGADGTDPAPSASPIPGPPPSVDYTYCDRLKRPRAASSGFQRSPSFLTRAGTFFTVKSAMRMPFSISIHVTGVETVASGRGRGEYTDASVLPQRFWL